MKEVKHYEFAQQKIFDPRYRPVVGREARRYMIEQRYDFVFMNDDGCIYGLQQGAGRFEKSYLYEVTQLVAE